MKSVKRIDKLTDAQSARMDEWADRWIEIGLRTGPADRERFAQAVEDCYRFAGLGWHGNVVWVSSPIVGAFAAPIAAYLLAGGAVDDAVHGAVRVAVGGAVRDAVRVAVGGPVRDAVRVAVDDAVRDAVHDAVGAAVDVAVRVAVDDAVRDAVHDAVDGAVRGAVSDAVHDAVGGVDTAVAGAVRGAVRDLWNRRFGGQLWPGGYYWGGSWTSFFREVCGLELDGNLWDRARAFEATIESACWWWPFKDFVMVCERPTVIHRELVDPGRPRGWGSHRLHSATGAAVAWPDGWGVYSWHGTRVPADLIDPGWTVERILAEPNTEIRRCAVERIGWNKYLDALGVQPIDVCADPGNPGQMLRLFDLPAEAQMYAEPVRLLVMTNASRDRDGSTRTFAETIPASIGTAVEASAWQFGVDPGLYLSLVRAT